MVEETTPQQQPDVEAAAQAAPGWPTPPNYRFDGSRKPSPLYHARATDFAKPSSPTTGSKGKCKATVSPDDHQDFWRRAKWSPDGSHLLAQSESHHLDLFRLVSSSSSSSDADEAAPAASASTSTPSKTPSYTLQHLLRIPSPTPLLTYTWYPFAHPTQPASWCFAFSSRDVPVRLVDAYTGKTRATYGIEDHVERFVGPHALAFTPDGASLVCGHGSSLSIFDVTRPGTNTCATIPLVPMRRAVGAELQRGVVAEVVVAQHYAGSGGGEQLVAVGTFSGTVGVYQRGAGAPPGRWNDSAKTHKVASSLCLAGWREEEGAGVVQLAFHPTASYLLFVSLRRSTRIKCYDLRYLSTGPDFSAGPSDVALVAVFDREVLAADDGDADEELDRPAAKTTAQRLFFDIDWAGRWLSAGSVSGKVSVWSLANIEVRDDGGEEEERRTALPRRRRRREVRPRAPTATWELAQDAVASVSLHPLLPLMVVASGSRKWEDFEASEGEGHNEESSVAPRWSSSDARLALWDLN